MHPTSKAMAISIIPSFFLLLSMISLSCSTSHRAARANIGVCYGELGNNLPSVPESIKLIQTKLKARRIKIYGVNPKIIESIRNTDLEISIMLPNDLIPKFSADQTAADDWVRENVARFYPKSKIRHLLIGNEVLSNQPSATWFQLVPAMKNIWTSVNKFRLRKIKIGMPLAMDCLESSFPPSSGAFRSTVRDEVIVPLLRFLNDTNSFFFVDAYPYFAWVDQPDKIPLPYALLDRHSNFTVKDAGSGLIYNNLMEQMLDAVVYAMKRVNYPDIPLYVAETGWPSAGHPGATVKNAETYNRNVLRVVKAGTPVRPKSVIPVTIFALYNENNKPGPETERNFGLFYPNGESVYSIDLSGKTSY